MCVCVSVRALQSAVVNDKVIEIPIYQPSIEHNGCVCLVKTHVLISHFVIAAHSCPPGIVHVWAVQDGGIKQHEYL